MTFQGEHVDYQAGIEKVHFQERNTSLWALIMQMNDYAAEACALDDLS